MFSQFSTHFLVLTNHYYSCLDAWNAWHRDLNWNSTKRKPLQTRHIPKRRIFNALLLRFSKHPLILAFRYHHLLVIICEIWPDILKLRRLEKLSFLSERRRNAAFEGGTQPLTALKRQTDFASRVRFIWRSILYWEGQYYRKSLLQMLLSY